MDKDMKNVAIGLLSSFVVWFISFIVYDLDGFLCFGIVVAFQGAFWGIRHWWKERSANNDIYVD